MQLVYGQDEAIGNWIKKRIPEITGFGPHVAVGVACHDNLIAGIVWHAYSKTNPGGNIEITVAADSPMWLRPPVVRALLHYPFAQLGCHRITAVISQRNERSRKFTERFGFKLEGVVRLGFGHCDALVYGMLREESSRWWG